MKKILFVLPLLLIFNFAFAQMTSTEQARLKKQTESQADVDKKYADAGNATSGLTDALSAWGSKVAAGLGTTYTSAKTGVMNSGTRAFSSNEDMQNTDSDAHKKLVERTQEANRAKLDAYDKRNMAAEKTATAYEAAAANLALAKISVSSTASSAYNAAAQTFKDTAEVGFFKTVALQSNFTTLSNRYNNVNDAMIALERNLDRSVMATYMHEKMRKMMSSDVMCKAAASCQKNGKNTASISTADMKSIFPFNSADADATKNKGSNNK